jgi:hypothetical protein
VTIAADDECVMIGIERLSDLSTLTLEWRATTLGARSVQ